MVMAVVIIIWNCTYRKVYVYGRYVSSASLKHLLIGWEFLMLKVPPPEGRRLRVDSLYPCPHLLLSQNLHFCWVRIGNGTRQKVSFPIWLSSRQWDINRSVICHFREVSLRGKEQPPFLFLPPAVWNTDVMGIWQPFQTMRRHREWRPHAEDDGA